MWFMYVAQGLGVVIILLILLSPVWIMLLLARQLSGFSASAGTKASKPVLFDSWDKSEKVYQNGKHVCKSRLD